MAKKKKELDELDTEKKEKGGSRLLTVLSIILIILIWLVIFGVAIKLDVGGFGSVVLRPILKDVPIINKILPDIPDEEAEDENKYPYKNLEEAMERITELEAMLADNSNNDTSKDDKIAELEEEVERLKVFEENQVAFEQRVKDFEDKVVFGDQAPNIEEYKKYYEELDPEHAEELYKQVVEQMESNKRIQELAKMYATMDPEAAAASLETMTGDLDLVASILLNMKSKQSAAILAAMDSTMAARITKKMSMME